MIPVGAHTLFTWYHSALNTSATDSKLLTIVSDPSCNCEAALGRLKSHFFNWLGNNLQVLEIMTQIKGNFKPQNHIMNVTDAFVSSITALLLSKPI